MEFDASKQKFVTRACALSVPSDEYSELNGENESKRQTALIPPRSMILSSFTNVMARVTISVY